MVSIRHKHIIFLLIFMLSGCGSTKPRVKKKIKDHSDIEKQRDCKTRNPDLTERHLIIAAQSKAKKLSRCFYHYMKFEENKKQKIFSCNNLTIGKDGVVKFVYSRGQFGSSLPKDLKLCIEQEIWGMSFKGLQLDKKSTIQFPVEFNSL